MAVARGFGEKLPLTQDSDHAQRPRHRGAGLCGKSRQEFHAVGWDDRTWNMPEQSGLRIDAGYREGDTVSPHYDAMLAKVIAWAPTRDVAIDRLTHGAVRNPMSAASSPIYRFSQRWSAIPRCARMQSIPDLSNVNLAVSPRAPSRLAIWNSRPPLPRSSDEAKAATDVAKSPWRTAGWMPVGRRQRVFMFRQGQGGEQKVTLRYGKGPATLAIGGSEIVFGAMPSTAGGVDLTLDGIKSRVGAIVEGHELYVRTRNGRFELHWVDPFGGDDEEQVGEDRIVAPLPGTVVALLAEVGAKLEKGAPILTLEVMKMEQTLRAPFAGVLKAIKCKVGDIVGEGVELAEIEPAGE